MPDVTYEFKRGDDFVIPMSVTDPANSDAAIPITDWVISSQIRYAGRLVSNVTVTVTDAPGGLFSISVPHEETIEWPIRELKCDIQFDRPSNGRVSSETFIINCMEDQTQ